MLRKLYEDEEPEWVGISFDLPGATFRHEQYTEYKATRRRMDDDLAVQLPYVRRVCEVFGLPDHRRAGLRGGRRDRHPGPPGGGAGPQGGGGLRRQGPPAARERRRPRPQPRPRGRGRRRSTTARRSRRSSGVPPERVVDVLALVGDAVDNVPGVPGIGEKGARDLVKEFGPLEGVLENADKVKRAAYREGLQQHARTRDPLQAARHPAHGRARHPRPGGAAAAAARPRGRPRALHRAGVRGPGQGVRARGERRAAPRTRVARPSRGASRAAVGGGARRPGRSRVCFVRDAREPMRAQPARASALAWRARAAPSTCRSTTRRSRCPDGAARGASCWSCCGRCSRTRACASSPRAASTTASCSCEQGARLREPGLRRAGRVVPAEPGAAHVHARGPRRRVPGRAAAARRAALIEGGAEVSLWPRPPRPPPRRRTSRCAWPSR